MRLIRGLGRLGLVTAGLVALTVPASAQVFGPRDAPHKGSVELSGGGVFQASTDLSNESATLTRNPSTGSGPLELFRADTSLASGYGFQARIGYYLTRALSVEGGFQLVLPELRVRLSNDFENASPTVATESINSYLFTGSALYHFGRGKYRPCVIGGAGHLRDLHTGDEVVETGVEYHAGGGLKSWFGRGRNKWGIRGEVLFSIRDGGVGGEDERRTVPSGIVSIAFVY